MKNYKRNLVSFFFVALITTILFTACPPQRTPSTGDPKTLTLTNLSSRTNKTYYYLDGAWYSDKACTKKVTSIDKPEPIRSTITVDFNGGKLPEFQTQSSDDYFKEGQNLYSWDFKEFVKNGSDEKFFEDGFELPKNGITENVVLEAKYESEEKSGKLPNLQSQDAGLSLNGYRNIKGDVYQAGDLITVNYYDVRTFTASFVNNRVKMLTLKVEGEEPKNLYYDTENAKWYKSLSDKGAFQDEISGDVKFDVTAPKWTVTLDKNTPLSAKDSDFSFKKDGTSLSSFTIDATLSTDRSDIVDENGAVKVSLISENTIVNGTYPKKAIGVVITPESANPNYKFKTWQTENGTQIYSSELENYAIKGDTKLTAVWENKATFKHLSVMDGGKVVDSAYYNSLDNKWYKSDDLNKINDEDNKKTSVALPLSTTKNYTITFNYDNGSSNEQQKLESAFLGYGLDQSDNTDLVPSNGTISLDSYEISDNVILESKWNPVYAAKPNAAKNGYKLRDWMDGKVEYNFNAKVERDITLKAEWLPKEYNTLTLNITGKKPKYLYYGTDDNTWYKALSDNNLLLDENKIDGEVSFNIPETEIWTVTFDKNTPNGANNGDFILGKDHIDVVAALALDREDVIETNGKVINQKLVAPTVIGGGYHTADKVGEVSVTINNPNYELEGWITADGTLILNKDLKNYSVSGSTTIKASWKNTSDFKVLTIKDGDTVIDTAYYNTNDNVWYSKGNNTSERKTTVNLPGAREKSYSVTLDYDNGEASKSQTIRSAFSGYALLGDDVNKNKIGKDGEIGSFTIDNDTTLYSSWEKKTYEKPQSIPTKNGYTFVKWSQDGTNEYNFDSAVTSAITIKALWAKKTYKTLTLSVEGNEQYLYYGSDGAWYNALGNDNLLLDSNKVTGDNRKFNIPKKDNWTVTLNANAPEGVNVTLAPSTIDVSPVLKLSDDTLINKDTGVIKIPSIASDTVITGSYPKQKIGKTVTATSNNNNYAFNVWQLEDGTSVSGDNLADVEVNGNTTIKATWRNIAEFFTLIVSDGGVEQERAYYNTADKQWYTNASISSAVKQSVKTPNDVKNYRVTLDYAGGKNYENGNTGKITGATLQSKFLGYGDKIGEKGLLSEFSIRENTTLLSKWSIPNYTAPTSLERDGYTFGGWFNNGASYEPNTPVTHDITLTASWNRKTYKTLTLNIDEKGYSETLYYGSDKEWYRALGNDNLLLVGNRVKEGESKFNIPSSPVWTAEFDKNTPTGAKDSEITINQTSIKKTPTLTLTPSDVISTDGNTLKEISANTIVSGTYPAVSLSEIVEAKSENTNFEFKEWVVTKADGTSEVVAKDNLSSYAISGDITIKATWENKSNIKTLRVFGDNDELLDTAYYNTNDSMWYSTNDVNALNDGTKKTSVKLPKNTRKSYTVTIDKNDNSANPYIKAEGTPISDFEGYMALDKKVKVGTNGSLANYTIENDTDLVAKWSDAKYTGLTTDPTRDGYVLTGWKKEGEDIPYDFDRVITSDITVVAQWREKRYRTLTLNIPDNDTQKLYYGIDDSLWYSALSDDNLVLSTNKVTNPEFNLPSSPKWTLTINTNVPSGVDESKFTISKSSVVKYPTLRLSDESLIDRSTGRVRTRSISRDIDVKGYYDPVKINEYIEARSYDPNWVFNGWNGADGVIYSSLNNYSIDGDATVSATWDNKTSFKLLSVYDGATLIDTAYYNTADRTWYVGEDVKSEKKTSVSLPTTLSRNIEVEFKYTDERIDKKTLSRVFRGYGSYNEIGSSGSLSSYSISSSTNLQASWSEVRASEPQITPTRDGYTFDKWVKEGDTKAYDFSKIVSEPITLNALWNKKTYKTLSLTIGDNTQSLYYGSDSTWYKTLGDEDTLLKENRIAGSDVRFSIDSQALLITFDYDIPQGMTSDDFNLTTKSIYKRATLTLSNERMIDKTTGVVKVSSISTDTTITGEYSQIKVDENVTATTSSKNWEFDKWVKVKSDGSTESIEGSIADQVVTEPTTFRATWKSKAAFTPLTLKNKAGNVVNTIYYNSTDDKWYDTDDITTATEIAKIDTPTGKIKYTVTLEFGDDVSSDTIDTSESSFTGYYLTGAINPSINTTGSLYNYRISEETELTERWSAATLTKDALTAKIPKIEGKTFEKWQINENGVDRDVKFDINGISEEIKGTGITLKAKWSAILTLKVMDGDSDTPIDTAYYNKADGKWYENETGTGTEKSSVAIPTSPKKLTVKFNYDNGTENGSEELSSVFKGYKSGSLTIPSNGSLTEFTIEQTEVLQASWSEVTATKPPADPTKDGYDFEKWYLSTDTATKTEYNFNTAVTGNITLVAAWKQKEYYTLTIDGKAYYYEQGSDNEWYRALGEGDKAGLLLETNKMSDKSLTRPDDKKAIVLVTYDGGTFTKEESDKNYYFRNNENKEYTWAFEGYADANKKIVIAASDSMTLPNSIDKGTTLVAQFESDEKGDYLPPLTKDGYTLDGYQNDDTKKVVDPGKVTVNPGDNLGFIAKWTKKKANTLTLSIPGSTVESLKTQTLYYGSDGAWYSKTEMKPGEGALLLDDNKLTGGAVKFTIPTAPTWTITVEKNIPEGATAEQITMPEIAAKTPTLSLDNTIVDATTGKVTGTISAATTVNGTYGAVVMGEVNAPTSENPNYTFKNWKVKKEGETTDTDKTNEELGTYLVSGDVTITAQWESKADFITVKFKNDGAGGSEEEIGTKYYNRTDKKWYNSKTLTDSTTTIGKPNSIPEDYYEVYLVDNDETTSLGSTKIKSGTFNGYFAEGVAITSEEDGKLKLNEFTTTKASVVAKARWTDVKVEKPSDPQAKTGYTFTGWKKQGEEGSFVFDDATIKGETTLVAMWEKITVYSLKIWKSNADLVSGTVDPTLSYYWNPEKEKWFTDVACTSEVADGFEVPNNLSKGVIVNLDLQGGSIDSSSSWKNGENIWSDFNGYYQPATYSFFYQKNDKRILPSNGIANDVKLYAASTSIVSCNLLSSKFTKSGSSILGFKREGQTNVENSITFVYEYPRQEYNVTAIWGHTLTVNYNSTDTAMYYYGSDDNWYQDVKDSSGAVTGKAVISEADLTNALSSRDITVTLDYDGGEVDEGNTSSYCKFSDSVKTNTFSVDIKYWQTIYSLITCDKVLSYAKSDDLTITPDGGEVRFITPTLTKSNYTFAGWKDEQGDTTVLDSFGNISAKIADGTTQTFTAVWELEASTPKFNFEGDETSGYTFAFKGHSFPITFVKSETDYTTKVSTSEIKAGDHVFMCLNTTASDGYYMDGPFVSLTSSDGSSISIIKTTWVEELGGDIYEFVMPSGNVTMNVSAMIQKPD